VQAAEVSVTGSERTDAELVAAFRGGAESAFAELVRRHQIGVFRLLLGLLGSGDDAERACEKVFFDAARRIDELERPELFYGWLLGLAREAAKAADAAKKAAAKNEKPKPKPKAKDPRALVKQEVRDILGELTNDERLALILSDLENETYEAIGSTLGISSGEAERVVADARTKFVSALDQRSAAEANTQTTLRELPAGHVLGARYRVEDCLGKGGMGAVYRAIDATTDRVVAVKTLLPESAQDPTLRRRFEREAEIIRRVQHPHFVEFVDAGQALGEPAYVVMEFLDGVALARALEETHAFEPRRALALTRQILDGLRHAHRLGVVHRDIKPDNVLLVAREETPEFVKILDLGIAKLVGPDDVNKTHLTQKGEVFGTPLYMSPEQVRGDEIDARADLYSLSVMLFEMLAARPPFVSNTSMGLFAMHLATPPPPLLDANPDLPGAAELQGLLDRGLAKDPAERYQSAEQFLESVELVLAGDLTRRTAGAPTGERVRVAPRTALPRAPRALPLPVGSAATGTPQRPMFAFLATRQSRIVAVTLVLALAALLAWTAFGFVGSVR